MIPARLRAYQWDLLILLSFLILPLLLFAGVSIGSQTMLPADALFQWPPWQAVAAELPVTPPQNALITDLVIQNYAWKTFTLDSIAGGEIPLWNPYLFAGAPFLANGQHSMLYPGSLLFFILSPERAFGWFAVSQLWLAGALMYVFGRVLGMRRGSAALAGLIYQGGGFVVTSAAVFPMIIAAVAWLPLLLACIERIVAPQTQAGTKDTTLWWVIFGAVALGVQTLAGHAEFTYYSLLIIALYALWRWVNVTLAHRSDPTGDRGWSRLAAAGRPPAWLAAMVALGLTLAAVQLVPLFEVGQTNFRAGSAAYEEVIGWAYPWRNAVTFLLPDFFGNPTHHTYRDVFTGATVPFELNAFGNLNPHGPNTSSWGIKNFVEGATYLGLLPLGLAAVGALSLLGWRRLQPGRRSQTLFFTGLAGLSVAFIFGTPLYALLYYGLPFIDQLHTPFRWVFPLALAVATLAGFGADAIRDWAMRRPAPGERDLSGIIIRTVGALFLTGGVGVLMGLVGSRLFYDQIAGGVERLFMGLAQAPDAFPSADAFFSYTFWQLLVLGVLMAASGVVLLGGRRRAWVIVAAAVIIVDLFLAGRGFHAAVNPDLLTYRPEAIAWLQAQPGEWRLTTYDATGHKALNANTPWLYGLQDIRGYDSIIPRQFTDYMGAIEPQNGLAFNRIQPIGQTESLESPLLDVLGVRYIVSQEALDLPKLALVWEDEGLRIYENLAVAPRAYVLPQTATVGAPDPLAALRQFDPRRFVVVSEAEIASGGATGPAQAASLKPAEVTAYSNNEVVVDASAAGPSWLVLNDSYAPGWRAYVRPLGADLSAEQEVSITRVNANFRGVLLEPGEWTVRFRYSPRSFQLGGLASFMSAIVLLFMGGVWTWQRFYRGDGAASATRSIAKNSAAPMALSLFNKAIDFVFAAYYLRVLGPADAGSFATAIAMAGIFEIIANYGLNILLIREVSQDRSRAGHFLFNSSLLRLAIALLASLPIFLYIWATRGSANPLSPAEITAIALMMTGMVFSGLTLGVSGMFYVHEQAEVPAAMSTVTTILKVVFGVVVLSLGYSFVGLAAVSILVNVITLVLLSIIAIRRFDFHGPWQVDRGMQREMLRLGFPLMLIHLLQTIFISVDVLILRQRLANGEEVVGWYNSAYKWYNALQIIPSYFTLALFPIISRAIKDNIGAAQRMYGLSLKLMLLLALPIAALTTFSAHFLIRLLGGPEFLPHGAIALQIVIWSIPFGWLNSVTNYVLIGLGLERMQPRAFVLAVGFNVITNWIFIPRFSYVAAGVTTVLSEVVLLVTFDYFLRRRMPGLNWVQFAWRPVLLTAVMIGAMWLGGQIHLVVALVVGVAVYLVGLWALRIIGSDERRALSSIVPLSVARRLRLTAD
jgi:O-antigen/teichoic acid export membrane protein